jgi:hypothetical protein
MSWLQVDCESFLNPTLLQKLHINPSFPAPCTGDRFGKPSKLTASHGLAMLHPGSAICA